MLCACNAVIKIRLSQGSASPWAPFLETLPAHTESPVLWTDWERGEYLQGSPVQTEASRRAAALDAEWDLLQEEIGQQPGRYDASMIFASC